MINARRILSYVRRAVDDYEMIKDGDKIAIGVSAGKDSLTLLCGLAQLRRFYPKKFEIIAITLDCGFESADFSQIKILCEDLGVEYHVIPTNIKQVVFDIRKEKNPCSLCSKLRHGALNDEAKKRGCNKVALGHHLDDSVETFMMNLIYEGRIGTFSPVTYLDRTDLTLIRPLIYTPEKEVRSFTNKVKLPVVVNTCPADKKTKREEVKLMIADLSKKYKNIKYNIFGAIRLKEIDGYKKANFSLRKYDEADESDEIDEIGDTDAEEN